MPVAENLADPLIPLNPVRDKDRPDNGNNNINDTAAGYCEQLTTNNNCYDNNNSINKVKIKNGGLSDVVHDKMRPGYCKNIFSRHFAADNDYVSRNVAVTAQNGLRREVATTNRMGNNKHSKRKPTQDPVPKSMSAHDCLCDDVDRQQQRLAAECGANGAARRLATLPPSGLKFRAESTFTCSPLSGSTCQNGTDMVNGLSHGANAIRCRPVYRSIAYKTWSVNGARQYPRFFRSQTDLTAADLGLLIDDVTFHPDSERTTRNVNDENSNDNDSNSLSAAKSQANLCLRSDLASCQPVVNGSRDSSKLNNGEKLSADCVPHQKFNMVSGKLSLDVLNTSFNTGSVVDGKAKTEKSTRKQLLFKAKNSTASSSNSTTATRSLSVSNDDRTDCYSSEDYCHFLQEKINNGRFFSFANSRSRNSLVTIRDHKHSDSACTNNNNANNLWNNSLKCLAKFRSQSPFTVVRSPSFIVRRLRGALSSNLNIANSTSTVPKSAPTNTDYDTLEDSLPSFNGYEYDRNNNIPCDDDGKKLNGDSRHIGYFAKSPSSYLWYGRVVKADENDSSPPVVNINGNVQQKTSCQNVIQNGNNYYCASQPDVSRCCATAANQRSVPLFENGQVAKIGGQQLLKPVTKFNSKEEAINYVKNQLISIRKRDQEILQQLQEIESKIRANKS